MSLGLAATPQFEVEPEHKSAGLAFLFSLIIPGTGQLYCGKIPRGFVTLGFFVVGVALSFAPEAQTKGTGLMLVIALWMFAFLDAYFTAREINAGLDKQIQVQNPRVAVILNALTAGFGYFYLGERTKGIAIFIGMNIARFVLPGLTGALGPIVIALLLVVQFLMGLDAYRIARAQVREALGPEVTAELPRRLKNSRLPAFVPVLVACLTGALIISLMVTGLALEAVRADRIKATQRIK